ncbi:hypothetical protein M405DRAFT_487096 [Rhizopogon salebrosus TDB-379]|nr:hypothetical protein M405DRAFT_487096 [Rhizopogon salebrosus TDB-379]
MVGPFYVGWLIPTTAIHGSLELVICERPSIRLPLHQAASDTEKTNCRDPSTNIQFLLYVSSRSPSWSFTYYSFLLY